MRRTFHANRHGKVDTCTCKQSNQLRSRWAACAWQSWPLRLRVSIATIARDHVTPQHKPVLFGPLPHQFTHRRSAIVAYGQRINSIDPTALHIYNIIYIDTYKYQLYCAILASYTFTCTASKYALRKYFEVLLCIYFDKEVYFCIVHMLSACY